MASKGSTFTTLSLKISGWLSKSSCFESNILIYRDKLTDQIGLMDKMEGKAKDKKLQELLIKSFPVIKIKQLRPVVMSVLKNMQNIQNYQGSWEMGPTMLTHDQIFSKSVYSLTSLISCSITVFNIWVLNVSSLHTKNDNIWDIWDFSTS